MTKEELAVIEFIGDTIIGPKMKELRGRIEELKQENKELRLQNERLVNKILESKTSSK